MYNIPSRCIYTIILAGIIINVSLMMNHGKWAVATKSLYHPTESNGWFSSGSPHGIVIPPIDDWALMAPRTRLIKKPSFITYIHENIPISLMIIIDGVRLPKIHESIPISPYHCSSLIIGWKKSWRKISLHGEKSPLRQQRFFLLSSQSSTCLLGAHGDMVHGMLMEKHDSNHGESWRFNGI